MVRRSWIADGSEYAECRRHGTQELLARCEAGRWLLATDLSKEERRTIERMMKDAL